VWREYAARAVSLQRRCGQQPMRRGRASGGRQTGRHTCKRGQCPCKVGRRGLTAAPPNDVPPQYWSTYSDSWVAGLAARLHRCARVGLPKLRGLGRAQAAEERSPGAAMEARW
jgi:hypothetical protein